MRERKYAHPGRPSIHGSTGDAGKLYRLKLKENGMVAISTFVPAEAKETLNGLCKKTGLTQGEVLAYLLSCVEERPEQFEGLSPKKAQVENTDKGCFKPR